MPYKNIENALAMSAELEAMYEVGEVVEHVDKGTGMIAAMITEDTEWFPEPDDDESKVKIEASEESPAYIVALVDGGSIPASEDDIRSGPSELPGESPDLSKGGEAEMSQLMAPVYQYTDSPHDYDELQSAKRELIETEYSYALSQHGATESELSEYSYEELLNIPGVDDPEVGFASDPNGWDRSSYLDAWSTVGGTWRSCYARMLRHFGPNMAKRWCAALKDEIYGTTRWRNRF